MLKSTAPMVAPRLLNSSLIFSTLRSGVPKRPIPLGKPFTVLSQFRASGPPRLHRGWSSTPFNSARPPVHRLHSNTRFRFNSNSPRPNPDPTPHLGSPNQSLSLTARLKALSRDYGWAALGVYIGLTILDLPFCFLAVRLLGTERIGHWEHAIINAFWAVVRIPFPDLGRQERLATEGPTDSNEEPVEEKDHSEEKASKLKSVPTYCVILN
jgi:N-terminal acetyltransferase 2